MIDAKQARSFLLSFSQELYTLQYFKGGKPCGYRCILRQELEAADSAGQALYLLTNDGKHDPVKTEFFWMANEGDGVLHGKYPRSKKNVQTLHSLYIDTDNCSLTKVEAFLKELKLQPSHIVNTSQGKYHLYFQLDPVPADKERIRYFAQYQIILARLGVPDYDSGCDVNMQDYSRLLRVPGFLHQKDPDHPHLIQYRSQSSVPPLKWDVLKQIFSDYVPRFFSAQVENSTYTPPTHTVTPSNRHIDMMGFIGSHAAHGVPAHLIEHAFYLHAEKYYEDGASFLPGGHRNEEFKKALVYSIANRQETEKRKAEELRFDRLLPKVDDYSRVKPISEQFLLPDDFFLNAPGVVGKITREICKTAYISSPAITFATVSAFIGALKSPFLTSEFGHAPCSYFLCLAPSGTGKNYVQEVLLATLSKLKLGKLVDTELRSDRGLINFLDQNRGSALILSDEVKDFLASISSGDSFKHVPAYIRNLRALLLKLYTSTNKAHVPFGMTGDKRETRIELAYPRLNYVGYGTPSLLSDTFSESSIEDGLFQRFLIITDVRDIERNPNFIPATCLNSDIYSYLDQVTKHLRPQRDNEKLAEIERQRAEIESEMTEDMSKKDLAGLTKALDELEKARVNAFHTPAPERRILPFSTVSRDRFFAFADGQMKKANEHKHSIVQGLYTRGAEQVGRLCTALSDGSEIDVDTMEFCIEFVESRIDTMVSFVTSGGLAQRKTESEDAQKRVLEAITEEFSRTGLPVTYLKIRQRVSSSRRPLVKEILEDLQEQGLIARITLSDSKRAQYIPAVKKD